MNADATSSYRKINDNQDELATEVVLLGKSFSLPVTSKEVWTCVQKR